MRQKICRTRRVKMEASCSIHDKIDLEVPKLEAISPMSPFVHVLFFLAMLGSEREVTRHV